MTLITVAVLQFHKTVLRRLPNTMKSRYFGKTGPLLPHLLNSPGFGKEIGDLRTDVEKAIVGLEATSNGVPLKSLIHLVDDSLLANGNAMFCTEMQNMVYLDRASAAVVDNVLVFATKSGTGRWLAMPGSGGGGGSGSASSFYYQPGGTAIGNTFTDPVLLTNAILAAGGAVDLYIDCTFQSPAQWPVNQITPGLRIHPSPYTPAPAIIGLTTTLGVDAALLGIAELDGVLVVNIASESQYMVYVGGSFGNRFTMKNGASIQRASDSDILAMGIFPDTVPFQLVIDRCINPFPNLTDAGAWNVNMVGSILGMQVFIYDVGPLFHLPSFAAGPGPGVQLDIYYDDTAAVSSFSVQGAFQGPVNFHPLAPGVLITGAWYVDISGKLPQGSSSPDVGDGSQSNPFNKIQLALNAVDAAARASRAPGGFQYNGYTINITEGYSNESLSLPGDSPIQQLSIRGCGPSMSQIGSANGPAFSWVLVTPFGMGSPPQDLSFEGLNFNTQDLVSNTLVFDGSGGPVTQGAFNNIFIVDCTVNNAGGNTSGTGVPLYIKSAQVTVIASKDRCGVQGNGTGPSVQVWNGQLTVIGRNSNVGLVQHCADYRPGAPPNSGAIGVIQSSDGATISGVESRGTPILFIPAGGSVLYVKSFQLDPTVATAFSTNNPGAWVGGTLPAGVFGPSAANIGAVVGVEGLLGSVFGPGPAMSVTFPDLTTFPSPAIGPKFFTLPGGCLASPLQVFTADPAGFSADLRGIKLSPNVFNGFSGGSLLAGPNVTLDLGSGDFAGTDLTTSGNGRFVVSPPVLDYIFDPTATTGGNVYSTIPALCAALSLLPDGSSPTITFRLQGTFNMPSAGMPVGGWYFRGCVWKAASAATGSTIINIPDGVAIDVGSYSFSISSGLRVVTNASTEYGVFKLVPGRVTVFEVREGGDFIALGTSAPLVTPGTGLQTYLVVVMQYPSTQTGGPADTAPWVSAYGTDVTILSQQSGPGPLPDGWIIGTATNLLEYIDGNGGSHPPIPGFLGTVHILSKSTWNVVTPADGTTYNARHNDWVALPANVVTGIVINLPSIGPGVPRFRVTKGGTGSVQVFSSGGQNIYNAVNGATTNFYIGDYQSVTMESDGTNWWRVS